MKVLGKVVSEKELSGEIDLSKRFSTSINVQSSLFYC